MLASLRFNLAKLVPSLPVLLISSRLISRALFFHCVITLESLWRFGLPSYLFLFSFPSCSKTILAPFPKDRHVCKRGQVCGSLAEVVLIEFFWAWQLFSRTLLPKPLCLSFQPGLGHSLSFFILSQPTLLGFTISLVDFFYSRSCSNFNFIPFDPKLALTKEFWSRKEVYISKIWFKRVTTIPPRIDEAYFEGEKDSSVTSKPKDSLSF